MMRIRGEKYMRTIYFTDNDIKEAKLNLVNQTLTSLQSAFLMQYIINLESCYCNRSDCSGRIKDSKKYDSVQEKIDKALGHIAACGYELSKDECMYLKKILQGDD